MKKLSILLIGLFCCTFLQVDAQISLGFKSGYVKAWQDYGDVYLPDGAEIHVNRFNIAALAYYKINDFVEIGIEPGFSQKGAACEPGFILFGEDANLLLNYAEVPMMLKLNSPIIGNTISVFGKAGIGASRLVTAYRELTVLADPENFIDRTKLDLNSEGAMRKWDYGAYGGLGIAVNLAKYQIFAETNMYLGFKDVDPENHSKNRTLQFGLGFMRTI